MELLIDNREKIKNNFNSEYNIIFKNLDLGDYILKYNNNIILIIERKTTEDYASSIKDGRYREQKLRLINNYPKNKILYLIEGDLTCDNKSYRYNKVSKDTIVSSITNTLLRDNIHVFHTHNSLETIFFIESMYRKIAKKGIKFMNNTPDYIDSLTNSVKIKKKSNMDRDICQQLILQTIPGISKKTSERIIYNTESVSKFIYLLNDIPNRDEQIKFICNLPELPTDKKFRKISKTIGENIIDYLL
jgi:ERCC4-type nuclease|tara:strand:- start:463 stop:1200 length:738 start_codon:yes stop_codon:yes gene_type:complete